MYCVFTANTFFVCDFICCVHFVGENRLTSFGRNKKCESACFCGITKGYSYFWTHTRYRQSLVNRCSKFFIFRNAAGLKSVDISAMTGPLGDIPQRLLLCRLSKAIRARWIRNQSMDLFANESDSVICLGCRYVCLFGGFDHIHRTTQSRSINHCSSFAHRDVSHKARRLTKGS